MSSTTQLLLAAAGVVAVLVIISLGVRSVYVIHEHQRGIVERMGRYTGKPQKPGLHFKRPLFDKLVRRLDLRLQNLDFRVEARTLGDGARVVASIFLEYQVDENKAYQAHYDLANPAARLQARATEVVAALLYTMSLNQAMESGKAIGDEIRDQLTAYAAEHGYLITNIVVTKVEPEESILRAMSEQAAQDRKNAIAKTESDAANARRIAEAEAAKKVTELQGQASAAQQTATFEAIRAEAERLVEAHGMQFARAMQHVTRLFEIAATRDAVTASRGSFVTVGGNGNAGLTQAVAAGTFAGSSHPGPLTNDDLT